MSYIHIPDPHPGRCQNYRDISHSDGYVEELRCLDYEHAEHVCRFPLATHLVITDRNAIYSQDSTRHALSKPWIAPWDTCPDCGVAPGKQHRDGCDEGGFPMFEVAQVWQP